MSRILALLFALSFTFAAHADEWTRLLIPTYLNGELPGAYGARWVTELAGFNASGAHQRFTSNPDFECTRPSQCADFITPGEFFNGNAYVSTDRPGLGRFAYVMTAFAGVDHEDKLGLTLHVRDLSRAAESHGVQVPIIRAEDTFTDGWTFGMPNVPMGSQYRQKLRVYDFDGELSHSVVVEIWKTYTVVGLASERLATRTLTLGSGGDPSNPRPGYPGFAQLDLDQMPELVGQTSVSVRIKPQEQDARLWAFVTVTNNETQQVTTIVP